MTAFSDRLVALGACAEAVKWVGSRRLATAWRDCPRGDWLLWYAARIGVDRRIVVRAACACARLALPIWTARYPDDARPVLCIETTEAWTRGEATIDEVREARRAAYAVYAAAAAAADAADAAADAADAAADAADAPAYDAAYTAAYTAAADAPAYDAAYTAAYTAARTLARRQCVNIVRGIIPCPEVAP